MLLPEYSGTIGNEKDHIRVFILKEWNIYENKNLKFIVKLFLTNNCFDYYNTSTS